MTASVGAFVNPKGFTTYGATKVYLGHLAECLSVEASGIIYCCCILIIFRVWY
jgi:short-subunit dehydrogenase